MNKNEEYPPDEDADKELPFIKSEDKSKDCYEYYVWGDYNYVPQKIIPFIIKK